MITYTLTTEGSSDRVLLRPIEWLLGQHSIVEFNGQWANPASFASHERDVGTRIAESIKNFPCNLLFVHRDSDATGVALRKSEIRNAVALLGALPPIICVVPSRMTEAWLLVEEAAIRKAASNPRGRVDLHLPDLHAIERIADPKSDLDHALLLASETTGRRRKQFSTALHATKQRVASLIEDLSTLRNLSAFREFEKELIEVLQRAGWGAT